MKKIINPFAGHDNYSCFGCDPNNDHGLKLDFYIDNDEISAKWKPENYFNGYHQILHGGIQATLLDEVAAWAVYAIVETAGFTARLNVRYRKNCIIPKGDITIKAKVREVKRKLAIIDCKLYDGEGVLCSDAVATYFIYPQDEAIEKTYYPKEGIKAFFE